MFLLCYIPVKFSRIALNETVVRVQASSTVLAESQGSGPVASPFPMRCSGEFSSIKGFPFGIVM
jgi:hypothetical protein